MHHSLGRRLTFGAVAVAAAITFAAPAYAAAPTITIDAPNVTLVPGSTEEFAPVMYADAYAGFTNAKMTFELSDDLGGVTVSDPTDICASEGPHTLVCVPPFDVELGPDGDAGYFRAYLDATDEAAGKTGKITSTFTADGIEAVAKTTDVSVLGKGDAVDLAAGEDVEISVKPGSNFDAKLQVTDMSDEAVHGAALTFGTDYAFASPQQFSNCFYRDDRVTACTFDQDFEPGTTYEVVMPYRLRADTAAPITAHGEFGWLTIGDFEDRASALKAGRVAGYGTAGNGGTLALKAKPSAARLDKQTDTNPDNNLQHVDVKTIGNQGTDFVALGATAKGAKGDVVTVPVGLRNDGPATVDFNRSGANAAVAVVTIPADTTVVNVPAGCTRADGLDKTDPKAVQYLCASASYLFKAKTTESWKFGLKLTADVSNAQGLIEANPEACDCDRFPRDTNKKNDIAKIVINPIAGGTGGAGDGGADNGGADNGGQGGSLPITGPQSGLLGGAAAVLIATGAVGFVLARRRRTRFEA